VQLKPLLIKLLVVGAFAAITPFGRASVITWSNLSATLPGGGNFGHTTNWIGGDPTFPGAPLSDTVCTFDSLIPGDLHVYSQDGINGAGSGFPIGSDPGASGISLHLTSNQIGSVTFFSPVPQSIGMGFNGIIVDSGAGKLMLGDATANQITATLRPSNSSHTWINNSANPVIINPNWQIQNAGGTPHKIIFQGTGDFAITNNLRNNNHAPANTIQWDATGTMTWSAGGANDKFNDAGLSNVFFNAGTVVIKSNGLLPIVSGGLLSNNAAVLKLDAAPTAQDSFAFPISGTGSLQVNSGTWKFSSASNIFTGNIQISGGEWVADANENAGISGPLGVGGTISFSGGTLGYGPSNAFDYSPRFSTSSGQAYSIDTGGQNIAFTNTAGLGGAGSSLSKLGTGTLTIVGPSTFTSATTIGAGKLVFQGPKSGTGNISVADGATLAVTATATQITPATLTVGTSSSATLEFHAVNSTTTAIIAANAFATTGTITINITCGPLLGGQTYPLLSWISGPTPIPILGTVNGAVVDWPNSLWVNASSKVIFLVPPPTLNLSNIGNALQLSWTDSTRNFKLQMQTNLLEANWADYPGGSTSPVTVPNTDANATMYFRLISVP
jgi:autotransporter-associated beta strand protein